MMLELEPVAPERQQEDAQASKQDGAAEPTLPSLEASSDQSHSQSQDLDLAIIINTAAAADADVAEEQRGEYTSLLPPGRLYAILSQYDDVFVPLHTRALLG